MAGVCCLCRQRRAGGLGPDLERLGAGLPIVGNGAMVAAEMEEVGGRVVNGQEALDLAGSLKRFLCRSRRRVGW
ncbi:hypothetical protein J2850_000010 [Azospirillum picis]|uniref:Uncharacterized protein n=1 Tax=Azospirillum picis TaxID=488438 RepID=A0ABU0ME00_9PROT|nr:hypothetical protein [Azospirillum picis]MDQ0531637.1 hypothetical protein [Azospirillum picis]